MYGRNGGSEKPVAESDNDVRCVCWAERDAFLVDGAVLLKQAWKTKQDITNERESWNSSLTFLGLASHTFFNPEVIYYLFVADIHA